MRKRVQHQRARITARRAARIHRSRFDDVEAFCLFVGFPRSGSSVTGQLLNGHREMVIAHELDAIRHVERGTTRDLLFGMIIERDLDFVRRGRTGAGGYDFTIDGQWQGACETLRIIGDKKAGGTVSRLQRRPELLDELRGVVGVPLKTVTVLRNPFDNIATIARRSQISVERATDYYLRHAGAVALVRDRIEPGDDIEVHLDDLIAEPRAELERLCAFFGATAPPDYLDACAALVFPEVRRTRFSIEWPAPLVERIEAAAAAIPMLARYRYADPPQTRAPAPGT